MIRINELGMMVAALLLPIAPTRPGAAATEDRSMHQVKQEFGKLNPNAPAELSRFSFLIGNWRFEAKVKMADGQWHSFKGTWHAAHAYTRATYTSISNTHFTWRGEKSDDGNAWSEFMVVDCHRSRQSEHYGPLTT